jgi:predicted RND superfamily exporter protein
MTGFIYRYRVLIVGISVMFSLAGLLLIPSAKTDPDIRNYIPPTLVSRINTDSIELQFGVQDIIMLLFHDSSVIESSTLERIARVTDGLSEIRGISDVMSLTNAVSIGGDDGFMVVGPAVPYYPDTEAEAESLKSSLKNNPLVMGSVVSDDFSAAAVIAYLDRNINEEDILLSVDSLLAQHPGKAGILGGGLPYIRRAIMSDVKRDGMILVPMALVIMLLLLWISFREWRGVVIPFTVVLLSLGVAMGLAPLLGWKLSIVSLLVPVMMIAIANNYGIHLIARYQEFDHSADQLTVKQIITKLIISLRKPIRLFRQDRSVY